MLLDPTQSRALFAHALENGYAILAVNADSHAAMTDVFEAARQADAPVIVETSLWQLKGRSFGSGDALLGLARYLADLTALAESDRYRDVPAVMHTDHIKGPETLEILGAAIRGVPFGSGASRLPLRASTLSLDASELSERENVDTICRLAEIAREAGQSATLEMETAVDEGVTPPEVAERLLSEVERRHPGAVCLFAPGVGTRHGLGDGYPDFDPSVVAKNVALLERVAGRPIGLALHGSSGLGDDDLAAAAAAGVVKVNWSSESLHIRSAAALEYYDSRRDALRKGHPQWKETAMDNGLQSHVAERYVPKVEARIRTLRGAGQAGAFLQALRESAGGRGKVRSQNEE